MIVDLPSAMSDVSWQLNFLLFKDERNERDAKFDIRVATSICDFKEILNVLQFGE